MAQEHTLTKNQILKDIEVIYQCALKDKKWHVALKAKETQAKILGLFNPQRLPNAVSFSEMTHEQLEEFTDRLEKNDPKLKTLNPADYGFSHLGPRK